MSLMSVLLLTTVVIAGGAFADKIVCYTYGRQPRCQVSGHTFSYVDAGNSTQPTSQCAQNYLVTMRPLGRGGRFYCTAEMDVPEQWKHIYSISHDETSTELQKDPIKPFLYGEGLKAQMLGKEREEMFLPKAHTYSADNHYSWIDYEIAKNKLIVQSSNGEKLMLNSDKLFNPDTQAIYIGVNRLYSTSSRKGSGICRFVCKTLVGGYDPQSSDDESSGRGKSTRERRNGGEAMVPLTGGDGDYRRTRT